MFGEHDTIVSSDDLDSQKVMKFVHVFHLELPREEYLDLVDVGNHQVIDIDDDEDPTISITSDKQQIGGLRHLEVDSV